MKNFRYILLFILIFVTLFSFCGCTGGLISELEEFNNSIGAIEEATLSPITSEPKKDGALRVHFIDIGQGDSEFIEFPDGKTMLIDAGEIDKGEIVTSYIKALGYDRINYIVASHPHSDHIGGMEEVLKTFPADCFYMPEATAGSSCFYDMLKAIEKNGCSAEYLTAGKVLINDDYGFSVTAVAPVKAYEDLNNYSAVLRLLYKDTSFLFTGDAEKEAEYDILNSGAEIQADVLKVGHHGSSTSSSSKFLNTVKPRYGVISCETGNSYGHPHKEILSSYNQRNIRLYRTDLLGTIIFETDGTEYKIFTGTNENTTKADSQDETAKSTDSEVFRTKSGECYHIEGCDGLSRTKIPTTIEQAKSEGLRPCPNCKPPEA